MNNAKQEGTNYLTLPLDNYIFIFSVKKKTFDVYPVSGLHTKADQRDYLVVSPINELYTKISGYEIFNIVHFHLIFG